MYEILDSTGKVVSTHETYEEMLKTVKVGQSVRFTGAS